jgi:hypothetical protein
VRLIEEDVCLVEAVGVEQSFDHWQAMAVASQLAGVCTENLIPLRRQRIG